MDLDALRTQWAALLLGLQQMADPHCLKQARSFSDVGEWKLALEYLCEALFEERTLVPDRELSLIKELSLALAIKEEYWRALEEDRQKFKP